MTPSLLRLMGVSADRAETFADPLTEAMDEYDINTRERQAAFLAQVLHETGLLRWMKEIWGPTPAQLRYEGRADLGNNQPGDGKRFLGRGLPHITGRSNYKLAGDALGFDLLSNPEWLERPALACRAGGWFWKVHGLNELADDGNFLKITKKLNGGTNGLEDRERLWSMARRVFA